MGIDIGIGPALLWAWAVMASIMALAWGWQRRTDNAGIVDVAWAFGSGAVATWLVAVASEGDAARRALVALLALAWSLRLGSFLARRVLGESEDGRYRHIRAVMGGRADLGFFAFFQVQATWTLLFAAPMWAASTAPAQGLAWSDWAGVAVFLVAVAGESVADRQLARFRASRPDRSRVCDVGLWRYSRHPNYFFEWVHWWAYPLIGLGAPHWWVTLAGVALVYVFLTRLTGIPHTEAQALRTRGDAYRAYQRATSAFFPLPRKRSGEVSG